MSETQVTKSSLLLTFLGSLGAILIFVLILFVAYLPNRPDAVNAQVNAARQAKADEARAAGIEKLSNYEVIDAATGTARIPIEEAMKLTVANYENGNSPAETAETTVAVEAVEEAAVPLVDHADRTDSEAAQAVE